MLYLITKALKRFKLNIKKYIFLMVQIMFGICMIVLSLNVKFTFSKQFNEFAKNVQNTYLNIDFVGNINHDDYKYIQTNFNPNNNLMSFYTQYSVSDSKNNFSILFVDESFYENIMIMSNYEKDKVYIGKNASSQLNTAEFFEDENINYHFNKTEDTFFNIPISSFIPLENTKYSSKALLSDLFASEFPLFSLSPPQTFEDYIIFPLNIYNDLDKEINCISSINILIDQNNIESINVQSSNSEEYLQKKYKDIDYLISNYYKIAEKMMSKNMYLAETLNILSLFIFIIVVFGFIGLLILLINKRKKEFAVVLMCGGNYKQIFTEIFIEVFLMVIISTIVGNIISIALLPLLNDALVSTSFYLLVPILCILGTTSLSFIVCMLCLYNIKHLSPVKILKNL